MVRRDGGRPAPTVGPRAPHLAGAAVLVVAGMGLAACSSTPHATRAGRHTPAPSSAPGTTAVPPTTSAPPPASSGSSAGGTACTAAELAGSVQGEQGGAGTLEVTVVLRNAGSVTCTMDGYPGMQLLAADGSLQPTSVQPGGSLSFEAVAPSTVSLAPGARAYVNIGFSDVPAGGQTSCPTAAALQVTPPGAADHLQVPLQVQACGGALHVSAVFGSGSAATQTTAPPTAG